VSSVLVPESVPARDDAGDATRAVVPSIRSCEDAHDHAEVGQMTSGSGGRWGRPVFWLATAFFVVVLVVSVVQTPEVLRNTAAMLREIDRREHKGPPDDR
jgi:heme exporter protein D